MHTSAGIDVGSGAVKAVIMQTDGREEECLLSKVCARIRRREVAKVVQETFDAAVGEAGVSEIHYIATTGEGEDVPFATGHFYGMTTHARGARYLEPRAGAVLDIGALHTRAVAIDQRGRVRDYKMTSQCASGSGQFLENIARYLGVAVEEIGSLSKTSRNPEKCSSICAVLAETDVINMVSRGIETRNILCGIHQSMAGRFTRLLVAARVTGVVLLTGGLAQNSGLVAALRAELAKQAPGASLRAHPHSPFAGALGAALWGAYRHHRLAARHPRTPQNAA